MITCLQKSVRIPTLNLEIYYSLLKSIQEDGTPSYGISVKTEEETVSYACIASDRAAVQSLLCAMIRGKVTPVTVSDIIEDWLLW